jgi:LmbE family N-acetylglucosaminyl deacetylase
MNRSDIPERALFIYAHPDDIEFSVAGTAAVWAKHGTKITYLLLTDGNVGSHDEALTREEVAATRRAEQTAAAAIVGATCVFLGHDDGLLQPTLALRKELVRHIRQIKPTAVVCGDPALYFRGDGYINHPDHRAAALATIEAVFPAAEMHLLYPDLLAQSLTRRYDTHGMAAGSRRGPDHPTFAFEARPGSKGAPALYRLRLKELLPPWPQTARLRLRWDNLPLMAEGPLAVIEAQAQGPDGPGPKVSRGLRLADLGTEPGSKTVELELPAAGPAQRWELRLKPLAGAKIRLEGAAMTTNPLAQVARAARWAFWAQGELMRRQGRPSPAAAILAWVVRLAPAFGPGLKSQVAALRASGQPREARRRLEKALPLVQGQPKLAAWVKDQLQKPKGKPPATKPSGG